MKDLSSSQSLSFRYRGSANNQKTVYFDNGFITNRFLYRFSADFASKRLRNCG